MKLWKVNAEVNKQTQVQETKDDQRTFGIGWPDYQFSGNYKAHSNKQWPFHNRENKQLAYTY